MKKIGIVGSRRRDSEEDLETCRRILLEIYKEGDTLVSGGCPKGGDRFAEIFAKEYNIPIKIHYPDKSKLDPEKLKKNIKWAYAEINFARNTLIAQDSDVLIAVVASDRKGGTEDTIKKAEVMNKFALNVSGYETYNPIWFEKDCSKEDFELAVKEAIHECLPAIIKEDTFIDGDDLLRKSSMVLESKGFKIIKPEMEISLGGECYYNYSSHTEDERPDAIFDDDWSAILENNKRVKMEMHERHERHECRKEQGA